METKEKIYFLKNELINWYKPNRRKFEWRNTNDPWKILLIEVISQQTQLERANSYYEIFIKHFPTPKRMAESSFSKVLKLWSGLGYNNRARRLYDASKILAKTNFEDIKPDFDKLPGVGKYTKNALLSFAYGEKVITEDTHVKKIISRFFGIKDVAIFIEKNNDYLLKNVDSRELNQSFMDFGSAICTTKNPKCSICPLNELCKKYFTNSNPLQSKFKGSNREVRGKIIKLLTSEGSATQNQIIKELKINKEKVEIALNSLIKDEVLNKSSNNNFEINS